MNNDNKANSKEKQRLSDLRNDLIVHFHQDATFYERRTYIMFFLISGFGLYACLDLYDKIKTKKLMILVMISSILFIITLLLSGISNEMSRKKSMYKADYFQNFNESDRKGAGKYVKIENGLKLSIGIFDLIGIILIAISYYKCFG